MSRTITRSLALVASSALAVSALALTSSPAHAATYDPNFAPVAADLIGVGSDTTQIAMHNVAMDAAGWNATQASKFGGVRIASFEAISPAKGGGNITLPTAAIVRPNGSGDGKKLLAGTSNNPDIDFARSSSPVSTSESAAGLRAFPFAVDRISLAVATGSTAAPNPLKLTPAQIVGIYSGKITDWGAVGGTAGVPIKAMIPQDGSGTRKDFLGFLKEMNGNVDVVLSNVDQSIQEHDVVPIQNDPTSIAPISVGRANLVPGAVRYNADTAAGGWGVSRPVFNVVREADVSNPVVQAVFGPTGFLCSPEARTLIKNGGLEQMASSANGGACGVLTSTTTANLNVSTEAPVATTTTLTGTASGNTVTLVAKPAATPAPTGTVTFFEGTTAVATNVPMVSGASTAQLKNVTVGAHTYKAVFNPTGNFAKSESLPVTVTVTATAAPTPTPTAVPKVASTATATFPKAMMVKAASFKKAKLSGKAAIVLASPSTKKATGNVVFKVGTKSVTVKLAADGTAKVSVPVKNLTSIKKLTKAGKKGIKIKSSVSWAGDTAGNASTSKTVVTKLVLK